MGMGKHSVASAARGTAAILAVAAAGIAVDTDRDSTGLDHRTAAADAADTLRTVHDCSSRPEPEPEHLASGIAAAVGKQGILAGLRIAEVADAAAGGMQRMAVVEIAVVVGSLPMAHLVLVQRSDEQIGD